MESSLQKGAVKKKEQTLLRACRKVNQMIQGLVEKIIKLDNMAESNTRNTNE